MHVSFSFAHAMRAMLTFGSLLIVLAVIAVSVRNELRASKALLPSAAASGPFVGTPQNQVSQYQKAVEQAMKADARHTADQAASVGEDGTR
jgi:predicted lipid-binding transport protein (Tim44 family)